MCPHISAEISRPPNHRTAKARDSQQDRDVVTLTRLNSTRVHHKENTGKLRLPVVQRANTPKSHVQPMYCDKPAGATVRLYLA